MHVEGCPCRYVDVAKELLFMTGFVASGHYSVQLADFTWIV